MMMKSGVKLYFANQVGTRDDLAILVQKLATVEGEDGGSQFRTDVATFIQKLAEVVKQQSLNLHPETVKLYQGLARKKLKFDGGSYFIELPLNTRVEALTLMLPIAQSLNMILYVDEPNYGYIFCPDGSILGEDGVTKWQDVVKDVDFSLYPFARNATEFKKIAQPAFAELAASHGFVRKKMSYMENMGYMRTFEGISQHLEFSYERSYEHVDSVVCVPNIYLYIEQVESIAEKFDFGNSDKISFSFSSVALSNPFSRFVRKWDISSLGEMQGALAKLDQFVFTEILDHATSIKSLDQLINRDFDGLFYKDIYDSNGLGLVNNLILACLAGNPNFEKLAVHAEAKNWRGKNRDARKEALPKLLKYLREEVKPTV